MRVKMPHCVALATLLLIASAGCGGQEDPIESRLKEIGYTPQSLCDEMLQRLEHVQRATPGRPAARTVSEGVRQEDRDRGGDGDRPDPLTFDAVMNDIADKIQYLQKQGTADALSQLLQHLDSQSSLDDKRKDEIRAALQSRVEPEVS
ncbi:hypothetical protein Mal4_41000 [Maioricimonas rarisocia]|uniref:Lipoprotein n=1 Tax=Maioricimonas rarisocia TaxID=2528026 RepID=A0A517ZB83_9PLAN|nr:hypothetical protein [Maioricimonas rarisocia]QDU39753.1 hypothetical protein Mal4_41000 [Maioricimonas rarisocia]